MMIRQLKTQRNQLLTARTSSTSSATQAFFQASALASSAWQSGVITIVSQSARRAVDLGATVGQRLGVVLPHIGQVLEGDAIRVAGIWR